MVRHILKVTTYKIVNCDSLVLFVLSEAHAFPSFFFKYSKPAQHCQNKQIMMECDEENLTYSFRTTNK